MKNQQVWKKEHYETMYSHTNCDACCADFQKKHPKIKLSSVFTHWNHKKQYRDTYDKMCLPQKVKPQRVVCDGEANQTAKLIRDTILELKLRNGERIPFEVIKTITGLKTVGTVRAYVSGYGSYSKKSIQSQFADIISTIDGQIVFVSPKTVDAPIMIPAKIVHKYDTNKKPSLINEDEIMVKDHNVRVEQAQILKEILSAIIKNNELISTVLSRFDAAVVAAQKKGVVE